MTRVKLTAIAFDAGTQIRAAIDLHVVHEYAEAMTGGATFPPIVLFHDGTQHYLSDGFHRFRAAQRLTFKDIDADVRPGTKEDALWFALGANKTNGTRLTNADKKHAVLLALRTWPDRSMHQLSQQIGCSYSYIQQVKPQVASAYHLPDRVTGKDGKSYPARRKRLERVVPHRDAKPDRTRAGRQQRHTQMRDMAATGHTSRQIAAELGLSEEGCRETLRRVGIVVPADKVMRGTHRHDSNRIVERIVLDAENLIEGVNLIAFDDLDRARLTDWLKSLMAARDHFGSFIRRLMKEQQKHGEAA